MDLEARRPALSELIGSGHLRITVAPKTGWEPSQSASGGGARVAARFPEISGDEHLKTARHRERVLLGGHAMEICQLNCHS